MVEENDASKKMKANLPPVLPDWSNEIEQYLTRPDKLPTYNDKSEFKFWTRDVDPYSLLCDTEPSPNPFTIKYERDQYGKIVGFKEVVVDELGCTSLNSTSFLRQPDKVTDNVRGSSFNYPFWPGGFEPPEIDLKNEEFAIDFENDLLTVPPGFKRGVDFSSLKNDIEDINKPDNPDIIDLRSMMDEVDKWLLKPKDPVNTDNLKKEKPVIKLPDLEEQLIPTEEFKLPVLKISESSSMISRKSAWAEMLDISKPIPDFEKRIKEPAHKFPFELDTFQKQAILMLEENKHIFVAAHTSAGKTVVAEYAIALSQIHGTKTIYTSPIKALSNQKFRDFKKTFKDIGLITGDFQINQEASCLIMTTEILRTMLYGGSRIIRDVEFVIFDEVHYINDPGRGHVWEEVMIMLPSRIRIVMLSATVPNTLEFANWLGYAKKEKVYVVVTTERPVPLEHSIFGLVQGKGDFFTIKAKEGVFLKERYHEAKRQLETEQKGGSQKQKDKHYRIPINFKTEKLYWISLLDNLKKQDKLPVVAFTLSRGKCDDLAAVLMSQDLTTGQEKRYIHNFFHKSIQKLKTEDQVLGQILQMEALLKQGIGVHHSGILPILKEIVEMLFQDGKIKFLFATETFAMGVNMPARTVVFDSIRKFDGVEKRDLQPAEYIQMAGRAGRRGLDDKGNVIIMCKGFVPPEENLKNMMSGSPMKLASQFRVTYSMILNILRVESMKMEDIMSHSFKEINRNLDRVRKQLATLNELPEEEISMSPITYAKLDEFYDKAEKYITWWDNYSYRILIRAPKVFHKGRVVIITHRDHIRKLGIILTISTDEYRVLVLSNDKDIGQSTPIDKSCETSEDLWHKMLALATDHIFVPDKGRNHCVLNIRPSSVMAVTSLTIKVDTSAIIQDWDQRQVLRFRNDEPNKACLSAVLNLYEKSVAIRDKTIKLTIIPLSELKIIDLDIVQTIDTVTFYQKDVLSAARDIYNIPNFESRFREVFDKKQKKSQKDRLEHLLSDESLCSYLDYKNKKNVLRHLQYINDQDIVQLKGRVACSIGTNELILTELILNNKFDEYEPAEIAALLASLVFQAKTQCTPYLTKKLEQGKIMLQQINQNISDLEQKYNVDQSNSEIKLNFGLTQVVYEWACGKVFAEIMDCTDVQEGIIVRCVQQLCEMLNDIKDAAHRFGDRKLKEKMENIAEAIKRDIVFTDSLYMQ